MSQWTRKCQECGHRQTAQEPAQPLTDSYRNSKCRKCRSEALDYGSTGWTRKPDGTWEQPEEEDEE